MRPLFFDFNNDKIIEEIEDQFMFRSQILIDPIVKAFQVEEKFIFLKGKCGLIFIVKKFLMVVVK